MRKYVFTFLLSLASMMSWANESIVTVHDRYQIEVRDSEERLTPLKPSYLDDVTFNVGWNGNWFVETKGGASAFIGTPVGCGDLFDRVMPVFQMGIGKWFTPAVGGRLEFQGFKFKNANLQSMKYQFVHADFMCNLTHNLQCNEYGLSRFDVIPFVGVGMIRNSSSTPGYFLTDDTPSGNHPFAFSYGIQLRYLLSDRLHLVGEVSGMTTMKNFDCVGSSSRFGDHMLNTSIGLSYTLGKRGWKKVIDARPYISQNNYLIDRYAALTHEADNHQQTETTSTDKNNYSGLNSLRYRMSLSDELSGGTQDSLSQTSHMTIGVPIYFYFKLNSSKLVDKSQLSNLDEIAKIAKEQNLTIHISGAADSATGTSHINRRLSKERAKYIAKQLLKRGISKESMKATCLGGINQFSSKEANRFAVVLLTQ